MKAVENPDLSSRVYWLASSLYLYTDAKAKPYIYLIDGGVSDNVGVQAVIESVAGQGGIRSALARSGLSNLGRVAFVIVDAQTRIQRGTILGDIPGLGFVVDSSSTIMINRNNFNTHGSAPALRPRLERRGCRGRDESRWMSISFT